MDNKWEAPSGGDWSIYYGGAIYLTNTENIEILNNLSKRLDGGTIWSIVNLQLCI